MIDKKTEVSFLCFPSPLSYRRPRTALGPVRLAQTGPRSRPNWPKILGLVQKTVRAWNGRSVTPGPF
jgi:hypothetical protein